MCGLWSVPLALAVAMAVWLWATTNSLSTILEVRPMRVA